jgi:hypothetical protein
VKQQWKLFRLAIFPALILVGAGCSGINASHSISPASFFLPGLLKVEPKETPVLPDVSHPEEPIQIAVNTH